MSLHTLSLWIIIPIIIVAVLVAVATGPRTVLKDGFNGIYADQVWGSCLLSGLATFVAIVLSIHVVDRVLGPPLFRALGFPGIPEMATPSVNPPSVNLPVLNGTLQQIVSYTVDKTKDTTTVFTEHATYSFPFRMGITAKEIYVGHADGKTWVCFNKDVLFTHACDVPI